MRGEEELVLAALPTHRAAFLQAKPTLRAERAFVYRAVGQAGKVLEYVDGEFQNDKEIVLEALGRDPSSLQFAADELRSGPGFLSEVLERFGVSDDLDSAPEGDVQDWASTRTWTLSLQTASFQLIQELLQRVQILEGAEILAPRAQCEYHNWQGGKLHFCCKPSHENCVCVCAPAYKSWK